MPGLIFLVLTSASIVCAEPAFSAPYQYLYPRPNSTGVHPETNIIIRFDDHRIDPSSLRAASFRVAGSASGVHDGSVRLSDDRQTIVFRPDRKFTEGELVEVSILPGISTVTNTALPSRSFTFTVSSTSSRTRTFVPERPVRPGAISLSSATVPKASIRSSKTQAPPPLPEDFPPIRILKSTAPQGDPLFLGNFAWGPDSSSPYLIILNRDGRPAFYRRTEGWDFTVQPNGCLTYYDESLGYFLALDSSYHVVDTYACGNGYPTNEHELRVLPNGHAFLMSYDWRIIPMDTLVVGGDTAAYVTGLVIQELDRDKEVVFEWRSWDHFNITDATQEDLTQHDIDYVHGNSIEIDPDGSLLISCRNMDEITKIDRATGDILWRWGGKHNEFTFVNDPIGFDHQHGVRRLSNGNVLFFDNGPYREYSRVVEYTLDETNRTATLVWQFRHNPDILGWALGYAQRLPNGNTLIGWGSANPTTTEVTPQGAVAFEMDMRDIIYTYRIYSLPWKTTAFVPTVDTLLFPPCAVGDSVTSTLTIANPTDYDISLTSLAVSSPCFAVLSESPIVLAAHDSTTVRLMYAPLTPGTAVDTLEVGSVDSSQGIFRRVFLRGSSPTRMFSLSADSLDFGSVARGDSLAIRIILRSISPRVLTLASLTVHGPQFKVRPQTPATVKAKDTLAIEVRFAPAAYGLFRDTLRVVSDGGTDTVSLRGRSVDPSASAEGAGASFPTEFSLSQNYPNPFNPATTLVFGIPSRCRVVISIFDALGREVETVKDDILEAGFYPVHWKADRMASGFYVCRMSAIPMGNDKVPATVRTQKLLLVR